MTERRPGEYGLFMAVGGAQIRVTEEMLAGWMGNVPGGREIAFTILMAVRLEILARHQRKGAG